MNTGEGPLSVAIKRSLTPMPMPVGRGDDGGGEGPATPPGIEGRPSVFARPRPRIAPRLLILILLFSTAVTLVSSGLQLYFEYRRDVDAIQTRLDQVGDGYLVGLAGSLWNLDAVQLRLQLEGMLRLPDMQMLEVDKVAPGGAKSLVVSVGQHRDLSTVSRDVPIRRTDAANPQVIGNLHAELTLEGVNRRLGEAARIILISQGIETFLLAAFILFIVHRLVTRHLFAIADHVDGFDLRSPSPPLQLRRKPPRSGDELQQVVVAINKMSSGLRQAYAELHDANAQSQRDNSVRRSYEERLERQANYDDLTGLPNRLLLLDRLNQAVADADRDQCLAALLSIDLDHFKNINDTLGDAAGDAVLKEAALRFAGCLRRQDTLTRIGGDEFTIILPGLADECTAVTIAAQIVEAFSQPFLIGGQEHFVTASLGAALYPADASHSQLLLRNANLAMHNAKDEGRNGYRFFTLEIDQRVQRRLRTESRLRGALARGEFMLHYQPIVDLASGRPCALEALLRWRQSDGTVCMPGEFIAIAEEMGLIRSIGEWVVATACAELRDMFVGDSPVRRVAVNVSARQIQVAGFARHVERVLTENGLPPECLELELTESVLLDDSAATKINLEQLSSLGVRLSIDDFGTGFSSLSYLQRYPFDTLKIDRSFIAAIDGSNAARLVETIITMAHGLGMDVVAEGVETEEQLKFLRRHQCRFVQGYLFSRPLPLDNLLQRLAGWAESRDVRAEVQAVADTEIG
jgi:diguanylate cyclase (GGDEF)-like protein